jgi:hypothetical protein
MKKIISFGDSFVFGSEIPGNRDGSMAWAGLAAKSLSWEYETLSVPGCGNEAIARQIYSYFATHNSDDTLAVINWTWTHRWDFYVVERETWITLGPTCVPDKLRELVDTTQSYRDRLLDFYKDYANSSLLWNKMRGLQTIFAAQQYLELRGITNIQTYMDSHLFDTQWHAPDYVRELQNLVQPHMRDWNGMNFLDWCRQRGHEITHPNDHPLLAAHQDAAVFWKDTYAQTLA